MPRKLSVGTGRSLPIEAVGARSTMSSTRVAGRQMSLVAAKSKFASYTDRIDAKRVRWSILKAAHQQRTHTNDLELESSLGLESTPKAPARTGFAESPLHQFHREEATYLILHPYPGGVGTILG
jgi:hypothetical protein